MLCWTRYSETWIDGASLMIKAGSGPPFVLTNLTLNGGKTTTCIRPKSPPISIRYFSCGNKSERMSGVCRLNVCLLKIHVYKKITFVGCVAQGRRNEHPFPGFWVMGPSAVPGAQLGAPALGTQVMALIPPAGTRAWTPPETYPNGCYSGCMQMQGRIWSGM